MTVRGLRELAALPLGPIPGAIREHSRALLKLLDGQIRWLDLELNHRWGDDPRVRRLITIPGIGPFVAILLVLELGEIHRFPSAKHVASYVGLTPRVRATATTVRLGHISKEGNRLLRWALVLAATQAARRPGPLRAWFRVIQQRKGTKAARVALARRLAEIVYLDRGIAVGLGGRDLHGGFAGRIATTPPELPAGVLAAPCGPKPHGASTCRARLHRFSHTPCRLRLTDAHAERPRRANVSQRSAQA
jgi:hypothetical protein